MKKFLARHAEEVLGVLSGFDRVRFRGTFRQWAYVDGMISILWYLGVLFKDFAGFAEKTTARFRAGVEALIQHAMTCFQSRDVMRFLGRRSFLKGKIHPAFKGEVVKAPPLMERVCSDPDDDKFLACAIAGGTKTISSGDKALRKATGHAGIEVLSPREFVDKYLK